LPIVRLSCALAAGGLLALLSHAQQQQTPAFKIAGHLVRHSDNRPIRGGHVFIAAAPRQDRQASVISGENGEFSFSGLPQGKYALRAEYRGSAQMYQQNEEFSTAIAVGPGLDSEHILFTLDSQATISGSVVDEDGEPVPSASVHLFTQSMARGRAQTELSGQTQTSAAGTFHFAHLRPGTYYVAVNGRPWYAQNGGPEAVVRPFDGRPQPENPPEPAPRSELDVAFPLTYYAGATTPDAATPIKLEEGAEAEIQFALHAVPALHISLDGIEGQQQPDQQVQASLSQVGPGGVLIPVQQMIGSGGIGGVAPGNYVLTANLWAQNRQSNLGSQTVTLSGDSTVHLNETVKTSVSGRVIIDGELPPNLAIWMGNVPSSNATFAQVTKDGSFSLPQVQPGRYSFLLANSPELYMQSVAVKGSTYKNGEIEVSAGAQIDVTITAARGLTKIDGVAVKEKKGLGGALVLLIPQDLSRGKFIPRDQSDSDGTFTLYAVAPGRYTLVAIANGRGIAYADPAVTAPYLAGGRVVDVPLSQDATVEVDVQPRR